jgi:alkyldihydroxyacetonephosphate synthase
MKRLQGWGNIHTDYPVPEPAKKFLADFIGNPLTLKDATPEEILSKVPQSKLKPHPIITTDPLERSAHARGQSTSDWVDMRDGLIDSFPDGVAYPASLQDVVDLIQYAKNTGTHLIPYGGGSSVVGHLTPLKAYSPTLSVDMSRMDRVLKISEQDLTAIIQAGTSGPLLEEQLNKAGYTLGHFPQSWEYSTLGGWIVTRSVGQQSYYYGRIEPLFAGGHLETPSGAIDLPPFPKSAAGPDLREWVLGSEGRYGILTEATMRIRRLPQRENFYAAFFPNWEEGVKAEMEIAQRQLGVCMSRLSDAMETETTMQLSGEDKLVAIAKKGLNLVGQHDERVMLIYGVTGESATTSLAKRQVRAIIPKYHGIPVNFYLGPAWIKKRFLTPYLRNTLWELGYSLDTFETSLPWSVLKECNAKIMHDLTHALEDVNERVLGFSHISHIYTNGGSMYVTYVYRRAADPAETLARWKRIKAMASSTIIAYGGTISHQHGVGIDHKPYLLKEKSSLGIKLLQNSIKCLDPDGICNPGKLVDPEN